MSAPKLTGRQIADRLLSVEKLCHLARMGIGGGNLKAWEKDADKLSYLADLLEDAERDLKMASDEIDARQMACEDRSDGWRVCEFCGCHTNAQMRACCQKGHDLDKSRRASR